MSEYKTDGHIVTDGESSMGIFSTVNYLNDTLKKNNELKNQLAEKDEIIREAVNIISFDCTSVAHVDFLNKPEVKGILKGKSDEW